MKLDKHAVATKAYGYPTEHGGWPKYSENDFAAATRLIMAMGGRVVGRVVEEVEKPSRVKQIKLLLLRWRKRR